MYLNLRKAESEVSWMPQYRFLAGSLSSSARGGIGRGWAFDSDERKEIRFMEKTLPSLN